MMGRVIEHRWESGASSNAHGLGTMVMQFEYHDGTTNRTPLYDRVGNRLAEYKAHQPSRSEKYRYDSASRLADLGYAAATSSSNKSFERGMVASLPGCDCFARWSRLRPSGRNRAIEM
jgi:hypothetical protein